MRFAEVPRGPGAWRAVPDWAIVVTRHTLKNP